MSNHKKAYLEITNRCNMSCSFCPGTDRVKHSLSGEEFSILASRLVGWAEYLYFHLMGEPLLHPLLPEFIRTAHSLGFKPIITTNGTLLRSCGDAILDAKPYKINISVHSFEANDTQMPFDEYLGSILSFAKSAAERGIITVLRLWNLDGRTSGAQNERNEQILEAMQRAFGTEWQKTRSGERLCERVFLERGDKFDWPDRSSDVIGDVGFCYGLRDQIGVLCDGTVVPCCLDRNGDITLGNLFERPLDDILLSKRARELYDGFTKHECKEELCKRCMRAGYYRQDNR